VGIEAEGKEKEEENEVGIAKDCIDILEKTMFG